MTPENLAGLLKRSELTTLDFKLEPYDVSGTAEEKLRKRSAFAKDIVSMANTPRDESAYIILGVKRKLDGSLEMPGIQLHIDDNIYQQQLEGLIYPHPRFQYEQIEFQGVQLGVIEIIADREIGPFYPQTDTVGSGSLRRNTLYWRRGTQNAEAGPDEQRKIHAWFRGEASTLADYVGAQGDWDLFVQNADVSESGRQYFLILAPDQSLDKEHFRHLAWVDWSLVLDLDPDSESTGALKYCRDPLASRRSIHRVTKNDEISGNLSRATYWYFCRGLAGRAGSLSQGSYPDWNKSYGEDLRRKLAWLAANSSDPVVQIAFWSAPHLEPFIRRIVETSSAVFGERITTVIVTEDAGPCSRVAEETGSIVCQIGARHFLDGLSTLQALRLSGADNVVRLPGCDGVPKEVVPSDLAWLEEDLELVHLGAGQSLPEDGNPDRDFLQGGQITWFGLGFGADVEREKLSAISNCVRRDLESRKITRINLTHKPGAGGSTVARRVLWNLRKDFPCMVLQRCVARETVERLARIYALCEKPLLILREGSLISDSDAEELAQLLGARHIPSVLLQVLRRYSDERDADRRFFVSDKLLTIEAERFRAKLTTVAPSRAQDLRNLAGSTGPDRSPFIFGLTAFAENFRGLRTFVKNHLAAISAPQKKLLLYFSIAHAYGQQGIAEQHFSEILGIPATKKVDLRRALNEQAVGLLSEIEKGHWRTAHNLVAKEILVLMLGEGLNDERNWNTRLADLACQFAEFCRTSQPVHPEDLKKTVERVFFFRNDSRILGGVRAGDNLFSELIVDIPSPEGRLRVFRRLVELFPDDAHYWAHLGRYYSIRLGQFDEAMIAVEKAIDINPADYVLHHMKGMIARNVVYGAIEARDSLASIIPSAKLATGSFEKARELSPDEDYGYISEAQMIIRFLDYAQSSTGQNAVAIAASSSTDPWVREAFQKIEDLLSAVRQHRTLGQPSEYEERCRADLDRLYGAHDLALQRWQNLLERLDGNGQCIVHAPPIRRQIVWTRLAQCGRNWGQMQINRLQRVVDLLELNLEEEPSDDRNIRLWMQGARFLPTPPTVDLAAERVAYWRASGDSMDAVYYSYVLQAVQSLKGSTLAGDRAVRLLEESRNRARYRRDRTRGFEWLGIGDGLQQLVHQDMLGEWDADADFWANAGKLRRVQGLVSSISGPHAGEIEVPGGMRAFFVPGVAGLDYSRDKNIRVTFFVAFSYEGLRAWSVEMA
jgi:tetratricopeptide (TPR) repeat protein